MKLLNSYRNGNYNVKIYDDGTKIRRGDSPFVPEFPESCDLKITNRCDLGCPHCHEDSVLFGQHADLNNFVDLIKCLPPGIELAIGGGDPLSHPDIIEFLYFLEMRGIIANITVNAGHLLRYKQTLNHMVSYRVINGIGTTYDGTMEAAYFGDTYQNAVIHFVMGIHTVDQLLHTIQHMSKPKVLILGYKTKGRGVQFYNESIGRNLYDWYINIHRLLEADIVIAFDNLALEQLILKRFICEENWQRFYQGDDGQFTFYVDLVNREYAVSSTSQERFKIEENDNFKTMFQKVRGNG